jgi:hypothetical protein
MSGPKERKPSAFPETIHRNEASQIEVDQRLAGLAQDARERRDGEDPDPRRITTLLEELVYTQARLLDLQTEQTRLLQAILQAVSNQGA